LEGRIESTPIDETKKRSPLVHVFFLLLTPCSWLWAAKPEGTLGELHPFAERGVDDDDDNEDTETRSDDLTTPTATRSSRAAPRTASCR